MRRALDTLYDAAALVAALFLVGTLAMVLIGIGERYLNFHLPGTDSYAGYCMAAAGFLALAHTFKRGEHIRVTLLLEHAGVRVRRGLELWALLAGSILAGLLAFYSVRLSYQSWDFHDISTGNDATPLWLPQLSMALGAIVLFIAVVDELVREWRGARAPTMPAEALHNE
ncbi:MAG TPA: TRAP transporter small permease [Casimicrobiaceae bacterium]|nr:TRAP transporter small permease [Casimicrobiaceae bacterium]